MNNRRRQQMESDRRLKRGERTQEESQLQHRSKLCFMEERRRAQEAHVEKLREQEKKGYEEEEDEHVYAVPNMKAGSSYLQTTDPRDEVEKIVMDGLDERKTRRGSAGLATRPTEREKEKGLEERENTTAKDDWRSKRVRWDTRSEETDEQDESTRQNVKKMLMASMKKKEEEREERVQVAPNKGAGGSYSKATTDLDEKGAQENKRIMKWARRGVGMAKGGEV